jgi:uncharacterized protein (DUF736 family)
MPEYDNKNSGVLFRNKKKETDKHPDYTGSYTDGAGEEFWLSAWIKKSKKGETFMSLSTTPKDPQKTAGEENQSVTSDGGEVPF